MVTWETVGSFRINKSWKGPRPTRTRWGTGPLVSALLPFHGMCYSLGELPTSVVGGRAVRSLQLPCTLTFPHRDSPSFGPLHLRTIDQDHVTSPSLGGWDTCPKPFILVYFSQSLCCWTDIDASFKMMADAFTQTHTNTELFIIFRKCFNRGWTWSQPICPSFAGFHIYLTSVILEIRWLFFDATRPFVTRVPFCDSLLLITCLIPHET